MGALTRSLFVVWTLGRPYNGGVLPCSKVIFVISFMYIFAAHSNKTRGSPNIGGVLPTSEGVIPTKQGNLRENKGLFCTYAHAAT